MSTKKQQKPDILEAIKQIKGFMSQDSNNNQILSEILNDGLNTLFNKLYELETRQLKNKKSSKSMMPKN